MVQCHCPICKTAVDVPDGVSEIRCWKCGNVFTPSFSSAWLYRRGVRDAFIIVFVLLVFAVAGALAYAIGIDGRGSNTVIEGDVNVSATFSWVDVIGGAPRGTDVSPRFLDMWELHANDTVRVVLVFDKDPVFIGRQENLGAPLLDGYDEVKAVEFIGCEFNSTVTGSREYRGKEYCELYYDVKIAQSKYGFDMYIDRPPHIHIYEWGRIFGVGVDHSPGWGQVIYVVAIPQSAELVEIYDFQPYRHIIIDEWHVFYYDLTNSTTHESIHIKYVPGDDAPPLDWTKVEAAR